MCSPVFIYILIDRVRLNRISYHLAARNNSFFTIIEIRVKMQCVERDQMEKRGYAQKLYVITVRGNARRTEIPFRIQDTVS